MAVYAQLKSTDEVDFSYIGSDNVFRGSSIFNSFFVRPSNIVLMIVCFFQILRRGHKSVRGEGGRGVAFSCAGGQNCT